MDGIEREFAGQLTVIRLNVQEPQWRALLDRYAFRYTPTFVLLDAAGTELWRTVGAVDPRAVERSLADG